MPFEGEPSDRSSHSDIVRNPQVKEFLSACEYIREPSAAEVDAMIALYQEPPRSPTSPPEYVMAIDGSPYESSITDRLPSTRVGYVKIGCVLIDMLQYRNLRVRNGRFVDPFRVAKLQDNNSPLTFPLPSANVRWRGRPSVRASFRAVMDAHLAGRATRFNATDPLTSLRSTLFDLAARRPAPMGTGDSRLMRLHQCPSCRKDGPFTLRDQPDAEPCPHCGEDLYPSDCLRIWEAVEDFQSNVEALHRFMSAVEHMLVAHYIRYLAKNALRSLAGLAVFVDGPLAVFGNAAWLHGTIMRLLAEVNERLRASGLPDLLVVGLQKSGQVVDHVNLLDRFLPKDRLFAISDDYRYRYILSGRDPASDGFGSETYYGQDFIYKTPMGRTFVFGLAYPFATKRAPGLDFVHAKTEVARYATLPRAIALIDSVESDLYRNALVPIALAHRYTAISLVPGGQVLDVLTRSALAPRAT